MAVITVIFRTRDDEIGLAEALAALVPAATDGFVRDVVVVDRGSRDGTLTVADIAGCAIVEERGGGGLGAAAELARGDWLLFLAPGAAVEADWQGEARAFIDRALADGEARRRAALFGLRRVDGGLRARLAETSAWLRTRMLLAPHRGQGMLLSRALYRSLGGHRAVGDMAGADLMRRIGRRQLTYLRSRLLVRAPRSRPPVLRSLRNAACLTLFALGMPAGVVGRLSG